MPDWNTLNMEATWLSGICSWREYWMNACTSPMVICPLATFSPPNTATMMKLRLPTNIMIGCIDPEKNWADALASYISSLVSRKRDSTSA